jgi:hypothetical protein
MSPVLISPPVNEIFPVAVFSGKNENLWFSLWRYSQGKMKSYDFPWGGIFSMEIESEKWCGGIFSEKIKIISHVDTFTVKKWKSKKKYVGSIFYSLVISLENEWHWLYGAFSMENETHKLCSGILNEIK